MGGSAPCPKTPPGSMPPTVPAGWGHSSLPAFYGLHQGFPDSTSRSARLDGSNSVCSNSEVSSRRSISMSVRNRSWNSGPTRERPIWSIRIGHPLDGALTQCHCSWEELPLEPSYHALWWSSPLPASTACKTMNWRPYAEYASMYTHQSSALHYVDSQRKSCTVKPQHPAMVVSHFKRAHRSSRRQNACPARQ